MAWIESHQKLERHPKTLRLMTLSGDPLDMVLGRLHRFWWWCLEYAEDGDLRKYDIKQISSLLGFDAEHLVTSKWIDVQPYFRVHDWWDYIGNFLQRKYKNYPRKWKEIRAFYVERRKNPRRTSPKEGTNNGTKNECFPILPNHNLTITKPNQTNTKEAFEEFWKAYPKKVGKKPAEKAWTHVFKGRVESAAFLESVLKAVSLQKGSAQWQKEGGQYIPNPATWLNQSRWLDEMPAAFPNKETKSEIVL